MIQSSANPQNPSFNEVKKYEHLLDDVMEIIDTTILKAKLKDVEEAYTANPSTLAKARLGIIYHEAALNLAFFSNGQFKGYSRKSYDLLSEVSMKKDTGPGLLPFVMSYKASALSLVSAETKNLKQLSMAFREFETAIEQYADISYCPEFMRASVAENLPWFFFKKRRLIKRDMQSIVDKQLKNGDFANDKIMSFTYWALANQCYRKNKVLAVKYLDTAIELDPGFLAGRKRAEELKAKLKGV